MAVGAAWAGIAGVLKATGGVNEVISTIMLNNIVGLGLGAWLMARFRESATGGSLQIAPEHIPASGLMPDLNSCLAKIGLDRSEEQTSELQSLMRNTYDVLRLRTNNNKLHYTT